MISASATEPAPLSASASMPTAANVAKHSAHTSGIASTTANARIAAAAIHASSGITHNTSASGIPTKISAVLALTMILHISNARNSSPAAIAITIARKFNAHAGRERDPEQPAGVIEHRPAAQQPARRRVGQVRARPNSHGHATTSSAAATIRPSPSSA